MWVADLADSASVAPLAQQAWDALGGIDVLVNNAAIPKRRAVPALAPAEVEAVMRVNFLRPHAPDARRAAAHAVAGAGRSSTCPASAVGSGSFMNPLTVQASSHCAGGAREARIVATGGGTRVQQWMQALADAIGLRVEVSAVPEGAALGAAFLGRMAAGLETSTADAARWASTERVVEPDPAWTDPMQDRYARFLELAQP